LSFTGSLLATPDWRPPLAITMLEITSTSATGYLHILLRGQITSTTALQLEQALLAAIAVQAAPQCLLDLSDLVYTSSAGLRVFLTFAKRVKNAGGQLVLCAVQPAVYKVLEMSGFTQILTLVPDVTAARDRFLPR
jgi:anti-anti-sigma factor